MNGTVNCVLKFGYGDGDRGENGNGVGMGSNWVTVSNSILYPGYELLWGLAEVIVNHCTLIRSVSNVQR